MGWFGRKPDFESAVRDELPVLYRVSRRFGVSDDQAEDLVQTTLLKAFRSWARFDGRYLRSWLIKILRREYLLSLRNEKEAEPLDEMPEQVAVEEPFWAESEWRDMAERILCELEKLPEAYRLAVHLCDVEEMSYEEAAEAMEVPVGTVRSRLFRGRALLRQRLQHQLDVVEGGSL